MARRNTFIAHWIFPSGESEQKQKLQITKSSVSHAKRNYSLTLDNFSPSSQQLVLSYILYPCKCPDVHLQRCLAQFWPNKHFSQRPCSVWIVYLLTWQNEGGYDEKSFEMACNWLIMTSSGDNNGRVGVWVCSPTKLENSEGRARNRPAYGCAVKKK